MQEEKNKIRTLIRYLKKTITDEEKVIASDIVFNILTKQPEWIKAERILIYHSLPDELSTLKYLNIVNDKILYLPKVNGDNLDVLPYYENNLQTGSYNIKEPINDIPICPHELDLIIVPGVAFDKNKNRLGRGKGFYDRLLLKCNAIKIGIGYDFQIIESVPFNANDIKMDIIITPNYLIR